MSTEHQFPWLAQPRKDERRSRFDPAALRQPLCRDCDFYREDHEEEMECSSFKMLWLVLERRHLTPQQPVQATAGPTVATALRLPIF